MNLAAAGVKHAPPSSIRWLLVDVEHQRRVGPNCDRGDHAMGYP